MIQNFSFMQVINLTPDSFSDGGKYNNVHGVIKRIHEACQWKTKYIDIGAESTAPMNQPISKDLELSRFEDIFYPILNKNIIPPQIGISIDTYHVDVFQKIYVMIRKHLPVNEIVLNDISGVIDDELLDIMKKYPDFKYVFCHSNVKNRLEASFHMDHVIDCPVSEIVNSLKEYFENALNLFTKHNLEDRIIFDPAFGFSKNMEQNLELIFSLEKLIRNFKQTWLLGISKKSFLKKMVVLESLEASEQMQREYLHLAVLGRWFERLRDSRIIIRGHDPSIFGAASAIAKNA